MAHKKLSEIIFQDLNKRIVAGEYQANELLPTERQLAERYTSSRIPVREALKKLADENIVKTSPGIGTIVLGNHNVFSEKNYSNESIIDSHTAKILLEESISLRIIIETEATRLAALNATEEDRTNIEIALFESITEIRKLKANQDNHFFEADLRFHMAVAKASHNEFIISCLKEFPKTINTHQYWSLKHTKPRDEVVAYHTQIYENLLDKNAEAASAAMNKHLSRVKKLLLE